MATRVIATRLALDGEKEFKRQMSDVNSELKTLKAELGYTEAAFRGQANSMEALAEKDRILRKEVEQQAEKVRALEQAVKDAAEAYGDSDKRTDAYRQSLLRAKKELIDMQDELQDTEKYLDEARKSVDKTADSIDEFGREVKDAGDGMGNLSLDGLIDSVGNLKGLLAGGAVGLGIGAITEIAGKVIELEESTREWRSAMGSLEVSSQAAGYTAEETTEAYDRLYGVLGDFQTTATTIANLQAIGMEQEDLITVIDAATGAWSKYGDSIPIDGLAESINETIRSGEVTGTFADILNWGSDELQTFGVQLKEDTEANKEWNEAVQNATTSEDYFNLALSECENQSERTQLMLQYLTEEGLAKNGEEWRKVNEDIVAANEAQNSMEQALGELGETVAPIAAFFRDTLAGALGTVNDVLEGSIELIEDLGIIFKDLNNKINAWIESWDFSGVEASIDRINKKAANTKWGDGTQKSSVEAAAARMDAIPHAMGLDFVPYDGYLAELHYGERVMTAAENSALDTLNRAVATLGSGRVSGSDTPKTVQVVVRPVLNGRVMGESVTEFQMNEGRANG